MDMDRSSTHLSAEHAYLSDEDTSPEEALVSEALLMMSHAPLSPLPRFCRPEPQPDPDERAVTAADGSSRLARQRSIPKLTVVPLDESESRYDTYLSPMGVSPIGPPPLPMPPQPPPPAPLQIGRVHLREQEEPPQQPTQPQPQPQPMHHQSQVIWQSQVWAPAGAHTFATVRAIPMERPHTAHAFAQEDDSSAQWSAAEDQITTEAVERFGCKWNLISSLVPGRTPASVRNRWHRIRRAARRRENAELPTSIYKCSRCGAPKKGHVCTLSTADAGRLLGARHAMDQIALDLAQAC
jgi:hypothetical protein